MNQESLLKSALIGGVALGVLSALPVISAVNCLCCAWVVAGGVLAAYLQVKNSAAAVSLGTGVLLGLITGVIGAVVDTLFSIPLTMAMSGIGMGFAEQMRQMVEEVPSMPPEARETLRSLAAGGVGVGSALFILAAFFKLFLYAVMAMIGGALGVALFEKRKPGAPGVPAAYQPPSGSIPPPPPLPGTE